MKIRTLRSSGKLLLLAPLAALASCGQDAAEMTHGTPQQFMANEVQTNAEVYWNAVGAVSELIDGVPVFREFQPETDEEWATVAAAAVTMREHGEVLASPAYSDGRGDDWMDFAQGLQDVARQAEQAAIDKSPEAVFEVGGTIYNVCTACHQAYPPAEEEAEAPTAATPAAAAPTAQAEGG